MWPRYISVLNRVYLGNLQCIRFISIGSSDARRWGLLRRRNYRGGRGFVEEEDLSRDGGFVEGPEDRLFCGDEFEAIEFFPSLIFCLITNTQTGRLGEHNSNLWSLSRRSLVHSLRRWWHSKGKCCQGVVQGLHEEVWYWCLRSFASFGSHNQPPEGDHFRSRMVGLVLGPFSTTCHGS